MRGATRGVLRRLCSRPRAPPPLVYLVAGEPSGDAIGAGLVRALRREYGAPLEFAGVGGDAMAAAGVRSLFPMEELSVMGFAEVVTSLPRLAVRLRQTLGEIRQRRPRLVVGIDSKGFCLRLLRALDPGGGPARCRGGPPRPACARVRPRQRHPACVHI